MSPKSWDDLFCPPRPQVQVHPDGSALWRAPAKLNLSLRVLGKREDGYHELDSVIAKVTLYDELTFRLRCDGQVRLQCLGFDCGPVQQNLAARAAERLQAGTAAPGVDIRLIKHIPPGSGLGGPSSDAAAVLKALNRLWGLGLAAKALAALAADLGSDVPLFLHGPASRVRGGGERVEPLEMHPFYALVYAPGFECPTAEVYAAYDDLRRRQEAPPEPPAGGALWQSLVEAGNVAEPPSRWRDGLVNDLEPAAASVRPDLVEIFQRLEAATGRRVRMTGSGSAAFVLLDGEREARQAMQVVPDDMRDRCRVVLLNSW